MSRNPGRLSPILPASLSPGTGPDFFENNTLRMEAAISEFLRSHNTMSLATSRDDRPYVAALFYASDGLILYFLSNPGSEHSLNIFLNPRVAATINTEHFDWKTVRGLRIMGKAYAIDEEESKHARDIFESKYPFLTGLLKSGELRREFADHAFFKIVPENIRFIDNSVHFGYSAEMQI